MPTDLCGYPLLLACQLAPADRPPYIGQRLCHLCLARPCNWLDEDRAVADAAWRFRVARWSGLLPAPMQAMGRSHGPVPLASAAGLSRLSRTAPRQRSRLFAFSLKLMELALVLHW